MKTNYENTAERVTLFIVSESLFGVDTFCWEKIRGISYEFKESYKKDRVFDFIFRRKIEGNDIAPTNWYRDGVLHPYTADSGFMPK